MNEASAQSRPRYAILVADDTAETCERLVTDICAFCGDLLEVEGFPSAADLVARAQSLHRDGVEVPLVIADQVMPETSGIALLMQLHELPAFRPTAKILLTRVTTLQEVQQALGMGALNGHLDKPWTRKTLHAILRMRLTDYFIRHAPQQVSRISELLDVARLSKAFVSMEGQRQDLNTQVRTLKRNFLANFQTSDEEVEQAMIRELDEALDHPARVQIAAGEYLMREGRPIDTIWIILSGRVQLMRTVEGAPIVFHAQTVGRIIGLLALALGKTSFFDCRAATEVSAIRLTPDELHRAMDIHPVFANHFVTVLVRTLARRNRRSVELQLEIQDLNRKLESERDQLAVTLQQLKNAQTLLVEHEKMATLGQMSAGIAHELNNPVAALTRAVEFLRTDVRALSRHSPSGALIGDLIDSAFRLENVSTREERKARKELARELGDEELARELVKIGIRTPEEVSKYIGQLKGRAVAERLTDLASAHQLGAALRNVRSCAGRIADLVQSLRSYARADREIQDSVNVHHGLDETLLLFGNQLRRITVHRDYGELPTIQCVPGQLNQVWTNLISNAIQAMNEQGELTIRTRPEGTDAVRIEIEDSGPGIAPEHVDKIFQVNFTTRQGRVDFGLGIGLPICQEIITRHQGTLRVASRPGQTIFTTILPVQAPAEGVLPHPTEQPEET